MTRTSIGWLVLLAAALVGWSTHPPARLVISEASTLWITGTSTVHDWRCDATDLAGWIDMAEAEMQEGIAGGELSMPAAGLECKNGTMNKKTRNALKADDHVAIRYKLTRAERVGPPDAPLRVRTTGMLTIAGESQVVEADVRGSMTADGAIRLTGELPLRMSTYGIDPPKAMLGTLKTGDDVVVHFDLLATPRGGS